MKSRYKRLIKKQRGFTLIELLAVILILGIIALIAIPSVNKVIEQSKKGAIEQSVIAISKAVEDQCSISSVRENKHYIITDGKIDTDLPIKNLPDSGEITVDKDCKVEVIACNGGYCAHKLGDKVDIITDKGFNNTLDSYVAKTEESCFIFDESTRTITGYHYDIESCPMRISIPATINNVPVEKIGDEAFLLINESDYAAKFVNGYNLANPLTINDSNSSTFGPYGENSNDYVLIDSYNYIYDDYRISYISADADIDKGKICYPYGGGENVYKPASYIHTKDDGYYSCNDNYSYRYTPSGNIEAVDLSEAINLKSIGRYAFYNNKINHVSFGDNKSISEIGRSAFQNNLLKGTLDLSKTNIVSIGDQSFSNNNIDNVIFPNKLNNIGVLALSYNNIQNGEFPSYLETYYDAFGYNPLVSLTFSGETKYILAYGWTYEGKISKLTLSPKTEIISYGAFENIIAKSIVIPKTVKYIGKWAFAYSRNIENIEYNGTADILEYTFSGIENLKNLTIAEGPKKIDTEAFRNAGINTTGISEVVIPGSVEYIGLRAFNNSRIKKLIIKDGVKTIEDYAFSYSLLNDITLGNTIEKIGNYVFSEYSLTEPTKLTLPSSLKFVGNYAFSGHVFDNLTIPSSVETLSSKAFANPSDALKSYKFTITVDKTESSLYGDDYGFGNSNATVVYTGNNADYKRNGNKYADGTGIYFNPVTGEKCSKSEAVSTNGTKTGCMKWYVYGDDGGTNINLLLNHNISSSAVVWNSSSSNAVGPSSDFLSSLKSLTSGWAGVPTRTDSYSVNNATATYTIDYTGYKARLLTTNEVMKIVGLNNYDVDNCKDVYYISNSSLNQSDSYVGERRWLIENLYNTNSYTTITNKKIKGYWLATPVAGETDKAWAIYNTEEIKRWGVYNGSTFGIRPVITIPRSLVE